MEKKDYNLQEYIKYINCSKATFERRIKLICEKYNIDRSLMMVDTIKKSSAYLFKKEWVQEFSLLFTMVEEHPFFRENFSKSNNSFDKLLEHNTDLTKMIESLQDSEIKTEIKSDAPYIIKQVENKLIQNISKNLSSLANFLSTTDSFFRFNILNEFNGIFEILNQHLIYREAQYLIATDEEHKDIKTKLGLNSSDAVEGYKHNDFDVYFAEILKRKLEYYKDNHENNRNFEIRKSFFQAVENIDKNFENNIEDFFLQPEAEKIYDALYEDIQDAYAKSDMPLDEKSEESIFFDLFLEAFKGENQKCNANISKAISVVKPLSDVINKKSMLGINQVIEILGTVNSMLVESKDAINLINIACYCYFKMQYSESRIESFARYLKDFIDLVCLKSVTIGRFLELEMEYSDLHLLKTINDDMIDSLPAKIDETKDDSPEEEIIKNLVTITNAQIVQELFENLDRHITSTKIAILEYTVFITRMANRFIELYNAGDIFEKEIKSIMSAIINDENIDRNLKKRAETSLKNNGLRDSAKTYLFDILTRK